MEALINFITILVVAALIGFVIAFPVLWLWNWLIPAIFGLGTITYWQAFGLYFLCTILFKGGSG